MNPSDYIPSEVRTNFDPSMESAGQRNALAVVSVYHQEPAEPLPGEESDEEILAEAHERFMAVDNWERPFRERARQEFEFVDGLKHWDAQMLDERKGRPCLTFDRIGPAVDQVVNDARQSPPEPRISPVGTGADKETAEVLQGLIRNIENDSIARVVWATGYEHAVKVGRGWVRVLTEWEDDDGASFKQKIVLRRVSNPFSIYPDPGADEFDCSDMRYCFVTEDLEESIYRETYPHSRVASLFDFQSIGDQIRKDWFPKGAVRVAEYWKVIIEQSRIAQLADGRILKEEEVTAEDQVRAWRPVTRRIVKGYKLNGAEILEKWDWPGKWIPIVPIIGREVMVDGKRTVRGMVRPAMDANLSYDFMRSKEAEAIGLSPISQWLVAEGQIENYEQVWADSNRKAYNYLKYKPLVHNDAQSTPVPPPIRISPSVDTSAITGAIAHAADDIRATTSMFRPDMGEAQPDQSGRAILAIQRQGDNAHFNYHDNLGISQIHALRIMVDLAPKIYDEERMETIFDPDGSVRRVWLNKEFPDPKEGVKKIFNIRGAARYDVTLGSGPSYASRRAQAQDQLMQIVQAMPGPMSRALDLVLKTFDIPGIDQIAERLRPPDVMADQNDVPLGQVVQQQHAQMLQMQQFINLLTQQLNQLGEEIRTKKLELASKERMNSENNATQLAIADLKNHNAQLEQEYARIAQQLEQVHNIVMQQDEQRAAAEQAQQQQQHQAELQASQQQHEAAQAAAAREAQAQQPVPAQPEQPQLPQAA